MDRRPTYAKTYAYLSRSLHVMCASIKLSYVNNLGPCTHGVKGERTTHLVLAWLRHSVARRAPLEADSEHHLPLFRGHSYALVSLRHLIAQKYHRILSFSTPVRRFPPAVMQGGRKLGTLEAGLIGSNLKCSFQRLSVGQWSSDVSAVTRETSCADLVTPKKLICVLERSRAPPLLIATRYTKKNAAASTAFYRSRAC